MIRIDSIHKRFQQHAVLKGVSLDVQQGDVVDQRTQHAGLDQFAAKSDDEGLVAERVDVGRHGAQPVDKLLLLWRGRNRGDVGGWRVGDQRNAGRNAGGGGGGTSGHGRGTG